jgi:hypothetical protein
MFKASSLYGLETLNVFFLSVWASCLEARQDVQASSYISTYFHVLSNVQLLDQVVQETCFSDQV